VLVEVHENQDSVGSEVARRRTPQAPTFTRAGVNLSHMDTRGRPIEERRRIAAGWIEASAQGLTQEQYARRCSTSARSLRSYLAEFAPTTTPVEQLRRLAADLVDLIARLNGTLERLPLTVIAGTPLAVDPPKIAAPDAPAGSAPTTPSSTVPAAPSTPSPQAPTEPGRRPKFDWGAFERDE
jgi:hypothetical protein